MKTKSDTKSDTNTDNKAMNVDENINSCECDKCSHMFPLCMIENRDLCCKRVNEVMERVFRG